MTDDSNSESTPESLAVGERHAKPLAKSERVDNRPHHIVAVGTSAGGFDALQEFFSEIPADTGAAFVVLPHLSADCRSAMDRLLGRHTRMPVRIVEEETELEANHIYLLAPRKRVTLSDCRLILHETPTDQPINLSINTFMRSMATNRHMHSVGIILSGTGSDGSQGIKSIHEAGGLVMVQDPDCAQFDGMPLSAIATGTVDLVDNLPNLARRLVNYFNQPLISGKGIDFRQHLEQHQDQLQKLFELLHRHCGIDFSGYKPTTVARRLEHRMTLRDMNSLVDYLSLLQRDDGPQELENLKRDMLIGVTEFFRDPEAFESLRSKVLHHITHSGRGREPVRIWCIGCSSGEEAFSLAMLFIEEMDNIDQTRDVKVFATDVDRDAINVATLGEYPMTIATEVSEERLRRFFEQVSDRSYRVRKFVRERVIFAVHNVLEDPPFSNMDIIVCRNLLIYFQPDGQNRALSLINFSLNVEGFLFLGSAETPATISDFYRIIDYKSRIFQKISDTEKLHLPSYEQKSLRPPNIATPQSDTNPLSPQEKSVLLNAAIERLFDAYLPPTLVVNSDLEVLHSYGDLTALLQPHQPGRMSDSMRDLLKPNIASYVQSALRKVQKEGSAVRFTDISLTEGDGSPAVHFNLRITPFETGRFSDRKAFAVSFEPPNMPLPRGDSETRHYRLDEATQMRLQDLENELGETRAELKLAHQELDTVRDDLQSASQELMASNEELQSVNEELYTVDTEYKQKIEELMMAKADVDNFLNATEVAAVFLDSNLRIRRFTPHVENFVNILPVDIGRRFTDLQLPFDVRSIESKLEDSVRKGSRHSEIPRAVGGQALYVKIGPYHSVNGEIDGAVLTVLDLGKFSSTFDALRVQQRDNNKTFHHNRTSAWRIDPSAGRVYVAGEIRELLGHSTHRPSMALEDFYQSVPTRDRSALAEAIERTFAEGCSLRRAFRLLTKDGRELRVQAEAQIEFDEGQRTKMLNGILQIRVPE